MQLVGGYGRPLLLKLAVCKTYISGSEVTAEADTGAEHVCLEYLPRGVAPTMPDILHCRRIES